MMKLFMFLLSFLMIFKLIYYMKLIIQNYILIFMLILIFNFNLYNFYWSKLYYIFSMDNISFNLLILTCWILSISLLSSNKMIFEKFNNNFIFLIILLLLILMMFFMSMNLMMFYIYFESSLIPIMLLIMGWGMQINRIQASMYMLFYTLFGSLPLFLMIIFLFKKFNFIMLNIMLLNYSFFINNIFMYFMLIMAFLIKMPMYFIHLWLPKAHVESPISGSMILAGIMLKLGSYGMFRLMPIFPLMFLNLNYLILMISIMGGIYASLICMNQIDLKVIVAYSSIVHMSILMSSMMTLFNWGYSGSFMMMIAHGLCSSAMFCLVNINYERIHSRNLLINKGMLNLFPSLTLWWFLICSSNFSAPPSLNLISEIMLWNSLISWFKFNMIMLILIAFFSTYYSIYMYSYSQHGLLNLNLLKIKFINCREFIILFLHWVPLNFLFLNLNILI
uniref:NADH-ubiquinone oxidoreductase chain 4 n=1 Tax=Eumacrocentrus sp. QL-2013 TaxID=1421594 RepID=A0A0A6ZL05_9HYME|nr:NADH dehydrogenase subunit 4 [Eumacrocentrus sp. QL-2013]